MIIEHLEYIGAGPIRFGMTQNQVRSVIPVAFKSFKRTKDSVFPTDAFESEGIYVLYKSPGVCEAVEVTSPSDVLFRGTPCIGQNYHTVFNLIRSIDTSVEVEEAGFTSYELGIGAYIPELTDSTEAPIESVILFEKGYYG